jgi:fatty-acyl-CoA synthase
LEIEPNCGFFEDDMVILLVPIHYVFGLYTIFSAVVTKQSMFIPQSLDIDHIVDCMIKYPITRINAVPSLFLALANNVRAKEIKNLRYGFIGGAPHTIEQFTQIEHNLGITLIPAYGMSECIGIAIGNYRDSLQNRSSNVGKVYSIHQKKFLSDGELCIKSPVLALEYLNIGPVTDADGWLHTGDLGRIDEQGYLHIEGRKKDIIIRNGNNISTIKIEAALLTLRYIESVAVVGVFDDRQGEVPCALAVLKNGEEKSEKEILDDLMMVLKKIEIPSRIIIVEKIPMTSTGKADKVLIKQIYAEHVKRANSE